MTFSPVLYVLVVALYLIGLVLCLVVRNMDSKPDKDEYKIATVKMAAVAMFVLALVCDVIALVLLIMSRFLA